MSKYRLQCTHSEWHDMADAIDKARDGSIVIKINKISLDHLMKDHAHFIQYRRNEVEGDV